MTCTATILGGPEDGREYQFPGNVPPPTLVITLPRPLTRADFEESDDSPTVESPAFRTVHLPLKRYSDGRWVYVWPTGTSA
jgi:hypothetical protein